MDEIKNLREQLIEATYGELVSKLIARVRVKILSMNSSTDLHYSNMIFPIAQEDPF